MVLKLLDGISLPRGIEFTIHVGQYGDDYIETANSLASAVRSLGLLVSVEVVSTRQFGEEAWLARRLRHLRRRATATVERHFDAFFHSSLRFVAKTPRDTRHRN